MIASKISRQFSRNLSGSFSKQNSSKILIEHSPPQQPSAAIIPEEVKDPQQPQSRYNEKRQSSRFPEIINVTPEPPLAAEEEKAILDHNMPSFASAEEYKTEFKYNLIEMLPNTFEGAPDHGKDGRGKRKSGQGGQPTGKKRRQEQSNKVIVDGPISKFIQK